MSVVYAIIPKKLITGGHLDIKGLVKENIRSLHPYEVKAYPCRIKLDANESPYPPGLSAGVRSELTRVLKMLNRYPDPEARQLRGILSRALRVGIDNVLHGNGSDELIYYLITTFGGPVMYPVPTFSMYGVIAQALGEERVEVPLDGEFDLDVDKMLMSIERYRPKLIFLSSPNNPTGNCLSSERILRIVEFTLSGTTHHASLVIIDEAYQPFSGKRGLVSLIKHYRNVVIMRTLSKVGLAALRVGFMIAGRDIIREVNKVRLPFNLNSVSQAVAMAIMRNKEAIKSNIEMITSERKRLFTEMSRIEGIHPYPSDANFILFRARKADAIFNGLIKRGILIRNMKGTINDCLRVTIGTPSENTTFLNALRELSGQGPKRRG